MVSSLGGTDETVNIVSASITRKGQSFVVEAELAAPVPADPALDPLLPKQIDHLGVFYALDTGRKDLASLRLRGGAFSLLPPCDRCTLN